MGSHEESLGVIGEHGKARVVEEMHILLSVSEYVRMSVCDFVGY